MPPCHSNSFPSLHPEGDDVGFHHPTPNSGIAVVAGFRGPWLGAKLRCGCPMGDRELSVSLCLSDLANREKPAAVSAFCVWGKWKATGK